MQCEFPSDFDPEIETSMQECTRDECTCHLDKEKPQTENEKIMRQFNTGATRDTDLDKLDYDGFLSPLVIKRYAEYLNKHRRQADGKLRDSDNWQQGIPLRVYMKSLWRHFMDMWSYHRDEKKIKPELTEEAICAVIFNASGYLHELLKVRSSPQKPQPETIPEDHRNNMHIGPPIYNPDEYWANDCS